LPKKEKDLGKDAALKLAEKIVSEGHLTREQHMEVFQRYLKSGNVQDRRIALMLLMLFLGNYHEDFDKDLSLNDLITYGNQLCRDFPDDFGKDILYIVFRARSLPAVWIDRVADEESAGLRKAFMTAIDEMAKRKSYPLDRIFGYLEYFLDDPDASVRDLVIKAMKRVYGREPESLHYFLTAHESGAGSSRTAIIAQARKFSEEKSEEIKDPEK
jgi:hypothetical protein